MLYEVQDSATYPPGKCLHAGASMRLGVTSASNLDLPLFWHSVLRHKE